MQKVLFIITDTLESMASRARRSARVVVRDLQRRARSDAPYLPASA